MFAGQVNIVSHSSGRTSAILKYFCPLELAITVLPVLQSFLEELCPLLIVFPSLLDSLLEN